MGNNYFVGGAVNPRDSDLTIAESADGKGVVFNGYKHFSTGGVISDLTVLEGAYNGTSDHIFAIVPSNQPGIQPQHNWDNVGLRITESGAIKIENVVAPWEDALGWNAAEKKPDPAVLGIYFGALLLPTYASPLPHDRPTCQLADHGSLNQQHPARFRQLLPRHRPRRSCHGKQVHGFEHTRLALWWRRKPAPFGNAPRKLAMFLSRPPLTHPQNKEKPTDEFYILSTYGNFLAHLRAAEALVNHAGAVADTLYSTYGGHAATLEQRAKLTPQERGEWAEWVASAKVVTTDTGLRVTAGVFEVTGAKATATRVGLDRFWRDLRTHTLHDPVAYKNRELGRYQLLGELPEPTWYT